MWHMYYTTHASLLITGQLICVFMLEFKGAKYNVLHEFTMKYVYLSLVVHPLPV